MSTCENPEMCWCERNAPFGWGVCLPDIRWADDGSQVMTKELASWENEGGSVNG